MNNDAKAKQEYVEGQRVYHDPELGAMASRVNTLASPREPRPDSVINAITQIDQVVSRLQNLREKIQQGAGYQSEKVNHIDPPAQITLSALLNEGPVTLHRQYDMMMEILEQIESELF